MSLNISNDQHNKYTPKISNYSLNSPAPQTNKLEEIKAQVSKTFEALAQAKPAEMSLKDWEIYSDATAQELGQLFSKTLKFKEEGESTLSNQLFALEIIEHSLQQLEELLKKASQSNIQRKTSHSLEVKIGQQLNEVEQAKILLTLAKECKDLSEQVDAAGQQLDDRIRAIEIGQSPVLFEEYAQLLRLSESLAELYGKADNLQGSLSADHEQLRAELFTNIKTEMQIINDGREEFIEAAKKEGMTHLLEAEARLQQAQTDEGKQSAWEQVLRWNAYHQLTASISEKLSTEVAASVPAAKGNEHTLASFIYGWSETLTSAVLDPLKILRYNPKTDTALQQKKAQKEFQQLIQGIAGDSQYFLHQAQASQQIVDNIHNTDPRLYPTAPFATTTSISAPENVEKPLTPQGKHRLAQIQRELDFRAELEKEPDGRYRQMLNVLFLGMQVFSGVQWLSQTIPQQAALLKQQAELLSIQAGMQAVSENLPPEKQVEMQHDLLLIEGILKGFIAPSAEEFSAIASQKPLVSDYIQRISGQSSPPFAKAATEQWMQRQLSEYRHTYLAESPASGPAMSFTEAVQNWIHDFSQPQAAELSTAASPAATGTEQLLNSIGYRGHLVAEALSWRGEDAANPFLEELNAIAPSTARWVDNWSGQQLDSGAINEIRDFYVRSLLNSYQRSSIKEADIVRQGLNVTSNVTVYTSEGSQDDISAQIGHLCTDIFSLGREPPSTAQKTAAQAPKDLSAKAQHVLDEISAEYQWLFGSSNTPNKRLNQAINEKNEEEANKAIQEGAKVDDSLIEAVRSGYEPIVKLLMENKANVQVKTSFLAKWSLAHEAADQGHLDVLKLLIEQGKLDINEATIGDHYTPLHFAVDKGRDAIIAYIVGLQHSPAIAGRTPSLNPQTRKDNLTPLNLAAKKNHVEAAKLLIDAGADLEIADSQGRTALQNAVINHSKELIAYLLEHQSNVNSQDRQGKTALHHSIAAKDVDSTRLLISHGADLTLADHDGKTATHLAIEANDISLLKLLSEHGADLSAKDNNGKTPFLMALESKHSDLIQFLTAQKVDTVSADNEQKTPLIQAVINRDLALVKQLSEDKSTINATYRGGAAQVALANGDVDLALFLLQQGVDPNLPDNDQRPLLANALLNQHPLEVIMKIVDAGADVNQLDKDKLQPIVYAGHNLRDCKIIEFLLERGTNINYIHARLAQTPKLFLLSQAKDETERACVAKLGKDEFADEYLFRKLLAHAWDISGTSSLADHAFEYEGVSRWGQVFFAQKMEQSLRVYSQASESPVPSSVIQTIIETMKASQNIDHETTWERYSQGLPVVLHTGFSGHAINILIQDSYLFICNRGALSSGQIEAYKFNRGQLQKNQFVEMMEAKNKSVTAAIAYYKVFLGVGTNTRQDEVTQLIQSYKNMLNYQTVGNCAWESMEAAVMVQFLLPQILANKEQSAPLETGITEQLAAFDEWTKQTELSFLEQYLAKHEEMTHEMPIDQAMVENLFAKAGDVLNERLKSFQQYEHIAHQKLAALSQHQGTLEDLKKRYLQIKANAPGIDKAYRAATETL